MSAIRQLMQSGAKFARSASERRNVLLANGISAVASCAVFLLMTLRFAFEGPYSYVNPYIYAACLIFMLPILLNRYGYTRAGRLAICWLPAVYVLFLLIAFGGTDMTMSSYIGTRYYLLAVCCPPFLLFDIPRERTFFLALLLPVTSLLLFDPIMESAGLRLINADGDYYFNNVRAVVSLMIVGSSCYMLKSRADRNEDINARLIAELADKNEEIRQQASNEVYKLNQELLLRIEQLGEREFILNQSQKIAKIGSWEYKKDGATIFWSDEMYSIFGLDSSFDVTTQNLAEVIGGEEGQLVSASFGSLLKTGEPLDLTFRTRTPLGYNKWLRLYAFPIVQNGAIVGGRGICHDITYYKEAEELLRVSDRKYRSLFEKASDAIVITDLKGNFVDANTSFCQMLGYSQEALLGMNLASVVDPEDLTQRPMQLERVLAGVNVLSERRMIARDGSIRDVEISVTRVNESNVMAIARDVTELRRAQVQTQISEAKFRGAFEYSAIGMTIVSLEGRWLQVNREFSNIVGYSEAELVGRHFQDITHPDDRDGNDTRFKEALNGEVDAYRIEKRYVHRNGTIVWADLSVSMIKDGKGNALYCVAQVHDITEEKAAREKLMVSQANMNATINNTSIMIWSIDREARLLAFNERFREHIRINYGGEPRVGHKMFDSATTPAVEDLIALWRPRYERALSGEAFELEESRFGREYYFSVSPIVEGEQVIGATIFAEDISRRKARDRELAEANKQINEMKLMALRSVMSPHFIFNVLNSIQFFIARNDRLNAITYLSTFSKLIRSILNHSVNNRIALADELEMLKNYVQLESTRFEQKFDFILDVSPQLDVDSVEIPSLLIQPYVENAILHGLYNKKSPGTLWIRVARNDDTVVFEIEDDGVGRAEAMRMRQRNFPAHKSVGLRVTEERLKLIRQENNAGFEIEDLVDSTGPRGTKVRISIPC